jgi:hypothetical protein
MGVLMVDFVSQYSKNKLFFTTNIGIEVVPEPFEVVGVSESSSRGVSQMSQVALSKGLSKVQTEQRHISSPASGSPNSGIEFCWRGIELWPFPANQTTQNNMLDT